MKVHMPLPLSSGWELTFLPSGREGPRDGAFCTSTSRLPRACEGVESFIIGTLPVNIDALRVPNDGNEKGPKIYISPAN
jgi:hypothetical protein